MNADRQTHAHEVRWLPSNPHILVHRSGCQRSRARARYSSAHNTELRVTEPKTIFPLRSVIYLCLFVRLFIVSVASVFVVCSSAVTEITVLAHRRNRSHRALGRIASYTCEQLDTSKVCATHRRRAKIKVGNACLVNVNSRAADWKCEHPATH